MNLLKNLRIGQKLALGFGIVLLGGLVLGLSAIRQLNQISASMDVVLTNSIPCIRTLGEMRYQLSFGRRMELNALNSQSPAELQQFSDRLDNAYAEFKKQQALYEPMITDEEERKLYQQLSEAAVTYGTAARRTISLIQQGNHDAARQAAIVDNFALCQRATDLLNKDMEINDAQAREAATAAFAAHSRSRIIIFTVLALMLVFGISLAWMVTRSITSVLHDTRNLLSSLEQGDLTASLEIDGRDELAEMGHSLNSTIQSLRGILNGVAGNASQLAAASEEISANAGQATESAQRQSDQSTQVAAAMQEMAATVIQVSGNSRKASEAAHQAAETAREGGKVVQEAVSTMHAIADSTRSVAAQITELGRSSEKIGTIAAVIDDIADQTNLLALNAAIEAARAGEQGRGFAVVADEVRKLAERTASATKEIAGMIQDIQSEARSAVQAMEGSTHEVELGLSKTEGSGKSLEEIIRMANQVGDMVTQIATAATQQEATTDQVNQSITAIAAMSTSASEGAEQTAKACADLSTLANELQGVIQRFKLGEHTQQGTRGAPAAGHTLQPWSASPYSQHVQ